MSSMHTLKLGTFSDMKYGKMPDKSKLSDSGFPVYSGYRIVGFTDEYHFEEPTLIVVARGVGGTGDVKLSPPKAFITNLSISVVVNPNIADKEYLYYYFKVNNLRYLDSGSAQSQITIGDLQRLEVTLPELQTQKKIAQALRLIDSKIEHNLQVNELLESMAMAIFKEWFIDFGPVKAKAEGKSPIEMSEEIAALFPASFENSELGPIPKGWRPGSYKDLMSHTRESVFPEQIGFETCFHYSLPNFDSGKFPIEERIVDIKSNKFRVNSESVLFSKLNPRTPRVWLALHEIKDDIKALGSTEFVVINPLLKINRWLTYCYLNESLFLDRMAQTATGTSNSHQRIKPENIFEQKLVLPPEAIFAAFHRHVAPHFGLLLNNQIENQHLKQTRDLLLPRLISGELELK